MHILKRGSIHRVAIFLLALFFMVPVLPGGSSAEGAGTLKSVAPSHDSAVQTQLKHNGLNVTWTSDADEYGQVVWGDSATTLTNTVDDDRGTALGDLFNQKTHRASWSDATLGQEVFYNIISGGTPDANGPYSVTLASAPIAPSPLPIQGRVFLPDGTTGGGECLAYVQVFTPLGNSLPINMLTAASGAYSGDLNAIYEAGNLPNKFTFDKKAATTQIVVSARCDDLLAGEQTYTADTADTIEPVPGTVAAYINIDVTVEVGPPTEVPIPSATGWGLMALGALFALFTTLRLRARREVSSPSNAA